MDSYRTPAAKARADALSGEIIGAAIEVRGIAHRQDVVLPINYRGLVLEGAIVWICSSTTWSSLSEVSSAVGVDPRGAAADLFCVSPDAGWVSSNFNGNYPFNVGST
jgi:hypothetical protein